MTAGSRRGPRQLDLLAALLIALLTGLAYTARHALNPDGVSYLDLAALLARGEWGTFVQGYWSPVYPALLGLASAVRGLEGARLIPLSHLLNLLCVVAAVGVIWVWGRRRPSPLFGRSAFAALLLCGAGPPRIEAVTPDLLLLLLLVALAYELMAQGGRRWLLVGILLGLAYLTKTSSWPWLLAVAAVRLIAADGPARRNVIRSTLVAGGVMLLWIVPLSLKSEQVTLGSAGRLNYCWYLELCDSRTPDSHQGSHVQYQEARLRDGGALTWMSFSHSDQWSYEPWSDPAEWDRGVLTRSRAPLAPGRLVRYWLRLAGLVFGLWLLPLLLAVVAPMLWVGWPPRPWTAERRDALRVGILGLAGLGQFIAVHAEPRLLAPFALLFALGLLGWLSLDDPSPRNPLQRIAATLGIVAGLGFLVARIPDGITSDLRITETSQALDAMAARFAEHGIGIQRIVVVGPAMPVTAAAFWVGSRITGQIPPRSLAVFLRLAPEERQRTLDALFAGRADVAWVSQPGGGVQLLPIGPAAPR